MTWICQVRWPDGRHREIDITADTAREASEHCYDTWGSSIVVTVTPKEETN